MICYQKHTAIYNHPKVVISDQGTQLVAAGHEVNWNEIQHLTAKTGTTWKFTPKGCPWRNGMAERSIALAKKTLTVVVNKYQTLNFAELEAAYLQVASIMNKRPLTARVYNEEEYAPISPSDLLLGRSSNIESRIITVWEDPTTDGQQLQQKLDEITSVVDNWWKILQRDSFPLFCPKKKWQTEHRNLQVGDIVLLRYEQQLGKDKFRLGKVLDTHPDAHNVVRTVTIGLRDHRKTKKEKKHEAKAPQTTMKVGIQRLVVLLPIEETWKHGLTSDQQSTESTN